LELRNKSILIVSQQDWGEMFISKNHYALELARRGNKVFYLPGPDQRNKLKPGEVKVYSLGYDNLYNVEHRLPFPYVLKFKARFLYDLLLKNHIAKVLKKTGQIDIIWSFDLSNTIPLSSFPDSCIKLFMPVDELEEKMAVKAAKSADAIFSVTNEILDKFRSLQVPRVFLNHGVADMFINDNVTTGKDGIVRVGLSGNFLRPDIDRQTLLEIISNNKNAEFHFWGSAGKSKSNLVGGLDEGALPFVQMLEQQKNVVLHGAVPPTQLAVKLKNMDAFLICYDVNKDQSKGTNYHKILEYLGAGKVVVSNNVSTYKQYPGIVEMVESRDNNKELPALFQHVLQHLDEYNAESKQKERISFTRQFTYQKQVDKIEAALQEQSL